MEIVKGTDLPELLEHLGYSVRRVGSYYTTREMDSLMVKDRRTWKRYSSGKGGDAISSSQSPLSSVSACGENCVRSFAPPLPTKSSILRGPQRQEFCGKDFREAVSYLLEFNGGRARDPPASHHKPASPEEKPAFILPIAHSDQRRVFACVVAKSALLTPPCRAEFAPLPCSSFSHRTRFAGLRWEPCYKRGIRPSNSRCSRRQST